MSDVSLYGANSVTMISSVVTYVFQSRGLQQLSYEQFLCLFRPMVILHITHVGSSLFLEARTLVRNGEPFLLRVINNSDFSLKKRCYRRD